MKQNELYRGGVPQSVSLATPQIPWAELGTITVAQAYPAVAARTFAAVAALTATKFVRWSLHNVVQGIMLRFQTNAENDATVLAVLGFAEAKLIQTDGSRANDHAVYLGQLTLTGGTQVGGHTNVFVDTIAASNGLWTWSAYDSGTDRIAVVGADAKGLKEIFFIATTLQGSSTLYCEGRTY